MIGNANKHWTFQLWVKAHCGNDAECLDFFLSDPIKKMQVYQPFDVDIVLPACNFIKNENPAQVSFANFANFFSL